MMRLPPSITERARGEAGVTNLMEYISLTTIMLILLVVVMFTVNTVFMEGPSNTLRFHAFTDIGNGISVRIVDLYVIAPDSGAMNSKFDIPNDVANQEYYVQVVGDPGTTEQLISVESGDIQSQIYLAGIGATKGVTGRTTGQGWNWIYYNSSGVSE